jgi:hypothetical protein
MLTVTVTGLGDATYRKINFTSQDSQVLPPATDTPDPFSFSILLSVFATTHPAQRSLVFVSSDSDFFVFQCRTLPCFYVQSTDKLEAILFQPVIIWTAGRTDTTT